MANRHFSARKEIVDNTTNAGLLLLDEDMRQREPAAFLAGEEVTETALAHARKLMDATSPERENGRDGHD